MQIIIENNVPIKVNAEFFRGINVFYGYSGTGKTYLFALLNDYFINNKDKHIVLIDYRFYDKTEDAIVEYCKNADIILLDNADLYISKGLISRLKNLSDYIVISMKDTSFFDDESVTRLDVEYQNQEIRTKKYG